MCKIDILSIMYFKYFFNIGDDHKWERRFKHVLIFVFWIDALYNILDESFASYAFLF